MKIFTAFTMLLVSLSVTAHAGLSTTQQKMNYLEQMVPQILAQKGLLLVGNSINVKPSNHVSMLLWGPFVNGLTAALLLKSQLIEIEVISFNALSADKKTSFEGYFYLSSVEKSACSESSDIQQNPTTRAYFCFRYTNIWKSPRTDKLNAEFIRDDLDLHLEAK